jgi:hypothetical protein
MQKVVGSSPIIRFTQRPRICGLLCPRGRDRIRLGSGGSAAIARIVGKVSWLMTSTRGFSRKTMRCDSGNDTELPGYAAAEREVVVPVQLTSADRCASNEPNQGVEVVR